MLRPFFYIAACFAGLLALAPPAPVKAEALVAAPTRFSVVVEGAGPDLILIPGMTSNRRVWDQAVASLGGHYRVHRVQIAGFGGEPARGNAAGPVLAPVVEELHAYIANHHLRRPMVAGHSVGGLMTLMLAQRHPEDVSRALIVDALPFYPLLFNAAASAAAVEPQAAAMRDAIATMTDAAWRAEQQATLAAMVGNEAAQARVIEDSLASDRSVVARALYDDLTTDVRGGLAVMQTPTTVAYEANETMTEERYGQLVRTVYAAAPHVRFVPVAASRHFIMLDQPGHFAEILAAFAAGH